MSKLSPLGQSMASLFTPEGERLRASQQKASESGPRPGSAGIRVPGSGAPIRQEKSGDSLGNPHSPGYESWGKKKKPEAEKHEEEKASGAPAPGGTVVATTSQGPEFVRLSVGWELLLVAQKKLCEKAKGIFTLLDGPGKYSSQKKNKALASKSRGCILDLDVQQTQEQLAWKAKMEKEKDKESA